MKVIQKYSIRSSNRSLNRSRNVQRGLSILGALLALVIGALLTIPIINAYLDSQRKTRVEDNLQDIRTIVADMQKGFGNLNQYGALTTAVGVTSGVIPERLRVVGTNTAQNKYNGAITLAPDTITVANDSNLLTWNNVPRADCADLVFGMEPLSRRVVVNGTAVKPNDAVLNAATMAAQCDSAAVGVLAFAIGRKG